MHSGGFDGPNGRTRHSSQYACAQSPQSASAGIIPCLMQLPMLDRKSVFAATST